MRTIALAAAALALAACSLTTRGGLLVGPADQLVTDTELRALYESHGFAEGGKFTEGPKNPSPIIRRNELQNVLLVLRQAQIYGYLRVFLAPGLRCSSLCGAYHTASSRLARNQKSLAATLAFSDLTEH